MDPFLQLHLDYTPRCGRHNTNKRQQADFWPPQAARANTPARRNVSNSVDASAGTADRLRTFHDCSGSPTQHTNSGWDNVTGLGAPNGSFLSLIGK